MIPGSILVCPFTTPAWTQLFAQAAGLVTDIGGILGHGSIVAREYGIPAVVGTGNCTQRIKHGQMVEVDGDGGTVGYESGATFTTQTDTQADSQTDGSTAAEADATAGDDDSGSDGSSDDGSSDDGTGSSDDESDPGGEPPADPDPAEPAGEAGPLTPPRAHAALGADEPLVVPFRIRIPLGRAPGHAR